MNNILPILRSSFQSKPRASSRPHADIVPDDFIVIQIVRKDSGKILVDSLHNLIKRKSVNELNPDEQRIELYAHTSLETSQSKLASLCAHSFIH